MVCSFIQWFFWKFNENFINLYSSSTLNWQRWDSNPRLRGDWCLKPAPWTARPRYRVYCYHLFILILFDYYHVIMLSSAFIYVLNTTDLFLGVYDGWMYRSMSNELIFCGQWWYFISYGRLNKVVNSTGIQLNGWWIAKNAFRRSPSMK